MSAFQGTLDCKTCERFADLDICKVCPECGADHRITNEHPEIFAEVLGSTTTEKADD